MDMRGDVRIVGLDHGVDGVYDGGLESDKEWILGEWYYWYGHVEMF
jgi:hypothetical protein